VDAETALPRRVTSRARPQGRHRSPDRLSVPQAAPVLVLAVPAAECAASAEIAAGITAVAGSLCPGAAVRVGYAGDGVTSLAAVLAAAAAERTGPADGPAPGGSEDCPYAAVVIPVSVAPDSCADARLADVVAQAGPAVTLTPPLGPHPLLAAALHDRLAEAGLVPPRRISGLTLVTTAVGVLVAAAGQGALPAAQTVAVLLAARLGVPVTAVQLGSRESLDSGVAGLRAAGAARLAMAPYVVGPEIAAGELAAAAAGAGAWCAPVLGAHRALGQLVTMRYGAALLDPRPQDPAPVAPLDHQVAWPVRPRSAPRHR
jgi:hypothetical protein